MANRPAAACRRVQSCGSLKGAGGAAAPAAAGLQPDVQGRIGPGDPRVLLHGSSQELSNVRGNPFAQRLNGSPVERAAMSCREKSRENSRVFSIDDISLLRSFP